MGEATSKLIFFFSLAETDILPTSEEVLPFCGFLLFAFLIFIY